jgi:hypothetical protein
MAFDSVLEDPGTGGGAVPISTKTQTDSTRAQVVTDVGTEFIGHGSANATVGGGQIVAANNTRRRITFWHRGIAGQGDVYLGAGGVSVGAGAYLPALSGASVVVQSRAAIHAIADINNASLSYLEEFE